MDASPAQTPTDRTARLLRLLAPKSIAVIGGREAGRVVHQCNLLGFEGPIWPVNRTGDDVYGRRGFTRLEDLPRAPDAAFIAIPREPTIEAVRVLRDMGAGGAVCYASGFAETGDHGRTLQNELVATAGDMPIIGPNCYGALNMIERAALWPDNHGGQPIDRGVAIISQSGNMGINFTMQKRALPLAYLLSLGNQAAINVNDCLEALLADERVTAIGLHIEGVDDIARFSRNALMALERGIPLVAFKAGRSEKGARATVSHTSTLSGSDKLYDALFERYGIARVHSVPAFVETLKLLSVYGPLPGNRLASLSCSGGEASLMADRAEAHGLVFPDLEPEHAARLRSTLNEFVEIANPLDYHTFIWGYRDKIRQTFSAMLSGGFDFSVLLLDFPNNETSDLTEWYVALDEFIASAKENNARAAVLATLPENLTAEVSRWLIDQGIMSLHGVEEGLTALAAAAFIGARTAAPRAAPLHAHTRVTGSEVTLDEWHAKAALRTAGVATPEGRLVAPQDAAAAADDIGYPVVLKAVGSHLAHKTEAGAVILNLKTSGDVASAADRLAALSDSLLIESMVDDGVAELLIGVAGDVQFGPHVIIGAGGTMVELLQDNRILLLPVSRNEIEDALRSLRCFALLDGWRGKPAGDIAATVDAIEAVCRFVETNADRIEELDINPMIVRPFGNGALAADALIRLVEGDPA
jgi:acetyl-CoA synthetase